MPTLATPRTWWPRASSYAASFDRIARGELDLRPEDITDSLLSRIEGAADRLADKELVFDQRSITNGE
jgi:hypothetical protein